MRLTQYFVGPDECCFGAFSHADPVLEVAAVLSHLVSDQSADSRVVFDRQETMASRAKQWRIIPGQSFIIDEQPAGVGVVGQVKAIA